MHMDNIQILGFRATIDSVGETLDLIDGFKKDGEIIQLLNADAVVSRNHIIHGVNQAFLAFDRGENLAKDISVEIVLRCSACRQIPLHQNGRRNKALLGQMDTKYLSFAPQKLCLPYL